MGTPVPFDEEFYYVSLDEDFHWRSSALARRFTELGKEIARELASEVGNRFEIQFRSYEDGSETQRLRSDRPALNPRAADALDQLARNTE